MGVTWTDVGSTVGTLVTAGAAMLTAFAAGFAIWYAWGIRKAQSEDKDYLSVTLETEVEERCDGSAWILVNAVLHNPSKIRCVPEKYRWEIWDVSKGDAARRVDHGCQHLPKGKLELEPGEVYPIPFIDRVVPKDIKVLKVYFGIPYEREDSQGLEWSKTTLIGRRQ